MDLLHPRCAGLDVHKKTVVGCVRVADGTAVRHDVRTFATTTRGLLALAAWLQAEGCTHAVLEATGIYWKPVWAVLATEALTVILAHAAAVRNMPGRKSDVKDAEWLADLLAHGLVRPSFVPPAPQQVLRELTRTRKQLVREAAAHAQRIHKLLETLHQDPSRKDVAWLLGIDEDVTNEDVRLAEVRNWIDMLVLPTRAKRH
jgi:transposase